MEKQKSRSRPIVSFTISARVIENFNRQVGPLVKRSRVVERLLQLFLNDPNIVK